MSSDQLSRMRVLKFVSSVDKPNIIGATCATNTLSYPSVTTVTREFSYTDYNSNINLYMYDLNVQFNTYVLNQSPLSFERPAASLVSS